MNLTEIAGYIAWGIGGILLIGSFVLIFLMYNDYAKNKKLKETQQPEKNKQEQNNEVSKFKSAGKKRALIVDKDKKNRISKDTLVKSVFGVKEDDTVGFTPQRGSSSLEDIAAALSDSPNTTNRFRAPLDEREIEAMENLKASTSAPKPDIKPSPSIPVVPNQSGAGVAPPPRITNGSNDSGISMPFGLNRNIEKETDSVSKPTIPKPLLPPPPKLK